MKKSSASPKPRKKRVQFTLDAPQAESVVITGTFCDWQDGSPLKRDTRGLWKATLSLPPGRYEYRFVVDGEWRDDPKSPERAANPFGSENAVVLV